MRLVGRDLNRDRLELTIDAGRIAAVDRTVGSGAGLPLLLPGLVDLQINGFAGYDLNVPGVSASDIEGLSQALRGHGTTGYLPTLVTGPRERMLSGVRAVADAVATGGAAAEMILGVHLEGPFISDGEGMRGAHDPDWITDPDPDVLDSWLEAADGLPVLVTLAPERAGAAAFVAAAVARGVRVGIGHCLPSPDQCRAAIDAGADFATHVGNGLPALIPRHPNHLWTLLAEDRVRAGLIADGDHLPADTLTVIVRAKTPQRCYLVSDAAALAHCPPGEYNSPIGGSVTVDPGGRLRMSGTPYLAGSGHTLQECLAWALSNTSLPASDLLAMATRYPADLLGATDRGRLEPNARADVLVVEDPDRARVLSAGEEVLTMTHVDWTSFGVD